MTVNCPQLGTTGRLGNQLYQLAGTIGLARAYFEEPCLPPWDYAPFFSVPPQFFGSCIEGVDARELVPHIDERARVYLQDIGLFTDVMDQIRDYLAPSELAVEVCDRIIDFQTLERPVLGVHVRRGDNVPGQDPATPDKARYHGCPGADYYRRAVEAMRPAGSVAVFSDDPEWCRAHLEADYFHLGVPRPKEHTPGWTDPPLDWIDWHLLASCDAFVLSNSSFGIFAALMAGGPATVSWPLFGPALDYIDASLMVPAHWERLSC